MDYKFTNDYTGMNSPSFVPVMKIYNLILLPILDNKQYNIKLSDKIKIFDKTQNSTLTQTVAFATGHIEFNSQQYFYFYIANGLLHNKHDYAIIINNEYIDLATILHDNSAKLLIGSLILDNDYSFMFDTDIPVLLNINSSYIKFNINNITNKYNYYQALTNNTILFFLDQNNLETLSIINNTHINNILIRPLFYKNFPLGSISINISNYTGVSNNDIPEFKIFINNKSYYINGNSLNITNLTSNTYSIKIIDRLGLLTIDYLNGQLFNKDQFNISIPLIKDNYQLDKIALPIPRNYNQPKPGLSNIMINLEHNESFELIGPNNFNKLYKNGYQSLYNVTSGDYIIRFNNKIKLFTATPNETVYVP